MNINCISEENYNAAQDSETSALLLMNSMSIYFHLNMYFAQKSASYSNNSPWLVVTIIYLSLYVLLLNVTANMQLIYSRHVSLAFIVHIYLNPQHQSIWSIIYPGPFLQLLKRSQKKFQIQGKTDDIWEIETKLDCSWSIIYNNLHSLLMIFFPCTVDFDFGSR